MLKQNRSCLVLKTPLGRVKYGCHILPPASHIFGKSPIPDKYDARTVINNWKDHIPSTVRTPGRDYIAMNIEGVKNGCTRTEDFTIFRSAHQKRRKIKQGNKFYHLKIPNNQFSYGIRNRPSTPIKNVICNVYGNEEIEFQIECRSVMKLFKSNRVLHNGSYSLENIRARTSRNLFGTTSENSFKLSRFKNIPSKLTYCLTQTATSQENREHI